VKTTQIIVVLFFILLSGCEKKNDQFREKLDLATLDGEAVDDKYLLVNFWATWCRPCLREMPSLVELEKSLSDQNIEFIYVSDEDPVRVAEFTRAQDLGIESFIMRNSIEVFDLLYLPSTYIVSPEGEVILRHEGEQDWASESISEQVRSLIK